MAHTPWWQKTTLYQIYPRSFSDSNNDGIGDIQGIISRLDYVRQMGFETIWLSPHYVSPQKDFGYDIADYLNVAGEYGTLQDVQKLIDEVHARGMKIIFDMILNHTSDEHPWFRESCSSRTNPRRNWYIWKDGRGRRPPNNWRSIIGGSGWKYHPPTGQWYFHNFLPFQPDLNFRNPEVKQTMFNILRFWLERGADGFRLDIFHSIYKDKEFRNNPFSLRLLPSEDMTDGLFQKLRYTLNQSETFELAVEVRALIDSYSPARFCVGEVFGRDAVRNYLDDPGIQEAGSAMPAPENAGGPGEGRSSGVSSSVNTPAAPGRPVKRLNLILLFELMSMRKITAGRLRKILHRYENEYPAPLLPTYALGNHDRERTISRLGGNEKLMKLLILLQFTARGVPITYYGDEVGIPDGRFPNKTAKDSVAHGFSWMPRKLEKFLGLYINRDGCRTPMQWDSSPNAGFCAADAVPWLPVSKNFRSASVEAQKPQPFSLLNIHKELLRLRGEHKALKQGCMRIHAPLRGKRKVLSYSRELENEHLTVVLNISRKTLILPAEGASRVLFSTDSGCFLKNGTLTLDQYSGIVYKES